MDNFFYRISRKITEYGSVMALPHSVVASVIAMVTCCFCRADKRSRLRDGAPIGKRNLYNLHNAYSEKLYGMIVIWRNRPLTSLEGFAKIHPSFLKRREAAAMTKTMNRKMNKTAAAACAAAAFCCACAASYTAILSVLGAMIMASIIICALVLLVLAAFPYAPLARITA